MSVRTCTPATSSRRVFISFAALVLYATRRPPRRKPPTLSNRRARSVSTLVLPEPAGAMTRAAAPGSATASSWSRASSNADRIVRAERLKHPVLERDPVNYRHTEPTRKLDVEGSAVADDDRAVGSTTSPPVFGGRGAERCTPPRPIATASGDRRVRRPSWPTRHGEAARPRGPGPPTTPRAAARQSPRQGALRVVETKTRW